MIQYRSYLSNIYWWLQSRLRYFFGSRIEEYRFRHRDSADVRIGFSNVSLPHREWFANKILMGLQKKSAEAVHIIEIGCGWGPNLEVLVRHSPLIQVTGIDISPASIKEGRRHFAELGLVNIKLIEGKANNLNSFTNSSADIVFSDATLLYIGPDMIELTINEMLRVASRRILLLEMHQKGAGIYGHYTRDGWLRDYQALLKTLVGNEAVSLEQLPVGLRDTGRWPQYGTLIDIDITKVK